MTNRTLCDKPGIAGFTLVRTRAVLGVMSGETSAHGQVGSGTAAGFATDLMIVAGVQGVLPRGGPV